MPGRGQGFFLFDIAFRRAVGPTQPPIQWVPGVKRPGCESDHSFPSSAEVNNAWSYTYISPYVFMAWYLFKPTDFTLSLSCYEMLHRTSKLAHVVLRTPIYIRFTELAKCNLDLVAVQEVRWDEDGSQPADDYGNGNVN
jgi:hypothetical protein